MKTMKKLQVAAAVAGLFAASTAAFAGSISQSGVTIAREVISRDPAAAQSLRAPTVTFSYQNGPTANANSSQDFNVTLELGGDGLPTWLASQLPTYKTISAVRANNGNTVVSVGPAGSITADLVAGIELLGVEIFTGGYAGNSIRYRFRLVNNAETSVSLGDLQMQFNAVNPGTGAAPFNAVVLNPTPAPADYALVTTIANSANDPTVTPGPGVTGSVITNENGVTCGEARRRVTVRARNFIGAGVGVEGETASPATPAVNNGYIVFETALDVAIGKLYTATLALPERSTDPAQSNAVFTLPTPNSLFGTTVVMPMGTIRFRNVPNLDAWDVSIDINYYKYRAQAGSADGDLSHPNLLQIDGDVDVGSLVVKIDSTNGFAPNSFFTLANNPFCVTGPAANLVSTAGGAVSSNSGLTSTVTFSHAQIVAATTGGAAGTLLTTTGANTNTGVGTPPVGYVATSDRYYLCYNVTGATSDQIPQSAFTGQATLVKQTGGNEQGNQSCPAPLAGLGGGVKIDVRNFFPYNPTNPTSEWVGVIRVINNSETQTADVYGQYIRADGKYGKWGVLAGPAGTAPVTGQVAPLAPREARYYSSKEIFDLLTSNSLTGAPVDNTGSGGLTAPTGQALAPNTRLRISSNTSSTLRVQSYIYNAVTRALVEVSGAQGADFVNIETYNSNSGVDSQDAQTGIKR